MTTRGRRRTTSAAAGVAEPSPLEAAAAPLATLLAGARVRNSKRMIWRASALRAGDAEHAGRSRRGERLRART